MSAAHGYTGQRRSRRRNKKGGFSQASTRRDLTLIDQHGREWTSQAGLKTGMPASPILPSFQAPWRPDAQYLRVNPNNPSQLWIDYTGMFRNRAFLMDQYHENVLARCRDKGLPLPTTKGKYSPEIQKLCGQPPKPVEPVVAAMQENPFILGETWCHARGRQWKVDPRLEAFVAQQRNTLSPEKLGFDFSAASFDAAVGGNNEAAAIANMDEYAWMREPAGDATEAAAPSSEMQQQTEEQLAQIRARREAARQDEEDRKMAEVDAAFAGFGDSVPDTDADAESLLDQLDVASQQDEGDLTDLDDEYDAAGVGGRVVHPRNAERRERQAPRRPTQTTRKKGDKPLSLKEQKAAQRAGRKTLASGAKPVIAAGGLD